MPTDLKEKAKQILLNNDRGGYTVPTEGLYPFQWNWDSAFVSLGFAEFDRSRAWQEIETLFDAQWDDGLMPHIVFHKANPGYFPGPEVWQTDANTKGGTPTSGITQPPVAATIVRQLWEGLAGDTARRKELGRLQALYPKIKHWHDWFHRYRDPLNNGLVMVSHPWETGRDNSVEWDGPMSVVDTSKVGEYTRRDLALVDQSMRPTSEQYDRYLAILMFGRNCGWDHNEIAKNGPFRVLDVGMSMILLRANRDLLFLAELLGKKEDAQQLKNRIQISEKGMDFLWNEQINAYCSYDLNADQPLAVVTNASFLAFYADAGSSAQREALVNKLNHIGKNVEFMLPSCDPAHEQFNPILYWRGPIWLVVSYMVAKGLREQGEIAMADRIDRDTLFIAEQGDFYESFSPLDGKGTGGKMFSWSAAIWLHLTAKLNQESHDSGIVYQIGDSETRPWGSWRVIAVGEGYICKEISVDPSQRLSLQRHSHRNEHWVMMSGTSEVTLGDDLLHLKPEQTVYIPKGTKHRIANPGDEPLVFVEIQTGDVLDESDIERFMDEYGRA